MSSFQWGALCICKLCFMILLFLQISFISLQMSAQWTDVNDVQNFKKKRQNRQKCEIKVSIRDKSYNRNAVSMHVSVWHTVFTVLFSIDGQYWIKLSGKEKNIVQLMINETYIINIHVAHSGECWPTQSRTYFFECAWGIRLCCWRMLNRNLELERDRPINARPKKIELKSIENRN